MNKLKVMSVFGTRPEAIKMAPLVKALQANDEIESVVCLTGQHREMLDSVMQIFRLTGDYDLHIMEKRQTLSTITTKTLLGMDEVLDTVKPDLVLVHGDTSTTFAGALAAALLVYGLALGAGVSRTTLVLAGLAVSGMLTAGMNTIKLLYPDAIAGASDFLVGGLSGVTLSGLKGAVLYLITGTLLALLLAADLNVLCLGEQSAASLGLHIGAVRFLGILAAALLAGAAVSFAGLLSFVGLLAPHIARRLVGNNHRILLPAAMLLGAAFVVLCDVLARCLFAPFELPVGILLSLIGGPFFLGLLLHGRGRRMYD